MQSNSVNAAKYLALVILVILCWLPHFNDYIMTFIDQALLQSSIVYASARSVNAIISLLQSAEVGIGIASIQPAQLLDPVNDLAEYIADAMRMAIGSLFIQRILFTMSSGVFFSGLFTLSAVAYVICDYGGYLKQLKGRLLASLVLIRFLIPLVVLSTGLMSHAFLDEEIDNKNQYIEGKVDTLNTQANATSQLSSQVTAKINSQKQTIFDEIEIINTQELQLNTVIINNQQRLDKLTQQINIIQGARSLTEKITLTELESAKPLIAKQQALKQKQAAINNQLAALYLQKSQLKKQLIGLNDQLTGNTGNIVSRVVNTVSNGITNMVASMESLFTDFLNLLSLLILKLLLIPLLFLYLFSKAFTAIWQRSVTLCRVDL
ncbi:hypothetical protein WNY63_15755 [Pseudoalteromonas neustonica]|uniref:Uncharacterized protein n=1 Tax=Pseudoalteromonas neustonica TaxID=1840331 RepID=A0ABU9U564_9GAMM